jgi:hypothetical protein
MKELLLRQAELNAVLDLNKNETQVVPRGEQDSVRLKSSRPRQPEYSLLESSRIPSGDESLKACRGISGPRAAPLKLKPNDVPNHSFV